MPMIRNPFLRTEARSGWDRVGPGSPGRTGGTGAAKRFGRGRAPMSGPAAVPEAMASVAARAGPDRIRL